MQDSMGIFRRFIEEQLGVSKDSSSGEIINAIKRLVRLSSYYPVEIILEIKHGFEEMSQAALQREQKAREEEQHAHEAHIDEVTSMELPLEWENVFAGDERAQGKHFEHISDALVSSLTTLGRVDIEYIASVTGQDCKAVILALKGAIYQNPETWEECFYKGWELSDEYLSGNIMRKWKIAKSANKTYRGYFDDNLKALESVLPPAVVAEDIYITLGSPWVPADVIDDFIAELFGKNAICRTGNYETIHDEITGTWEIPEKGRYCHSARVTNTYGTERIEALYILERTLNLKAVSVTDEVSSPNAKSGKKRVINEEETAAALEKQQKLIRRFQKWVWTDPDRKKRLEQIFEERYSSVQRRIFDGSFLEFPGMSPDVQLYPYQKDAAARIIFTPNTLLAHDVGAGKTFVMIAAGQELRRMRLSRKNLYVVPNNLVGQWDLIFREMYPDANLLCVEPKSFQPKKRQDVLRKVRDEDFDGIIMAYSCFSEIPLSQDCRKDSLSEQIDQIRKQLENKAKAVSALRRILKKLEHDLLELEHASSLLEPDITFDTLGITRIFVDEAHNFKNVAIRSKIDNVLGISGGGSMKCQDMMDKIRMVQKQNDGKGAVLATGTPYASPYQH